MRHWQLWTMCITIWTLILTSGFALAQAPLPLSDGSALYRSGELLVKFKDGTEKEKRAAVHGRYGGRAVRQFSVIAADHVRLRPGQSVEEGLKEYGANPLVEAVSPNYRRQASAKPVKPPTTIPDPRLAELWALNNTGQTGGIPDADIDAPEAWGITAGSSEVVLAVIDSGIDYLHGDLAANMWTNTSELAGNGKDDDGNGYIDDIYGINAITGSGDPMDDHSHGTHVAGTIGAVGDNGVGIAGVNKQVRLMALKFLSADGYGYDADAIECLQYLRVMKDRGVNIAAVNNSWGGTSTNTVLKDAIFAVRDIVFVAAAGNDANDNDLWPRHFPAGYELPNIISVAASNASDVMSAFSSYGKTTTHLLAPGEAILSTVPGNGYAVYSGTSMATPHVTGVVGLLKAAKPTLNGISLKNLLLTGGDPVAAAADTTVTGRRLNANGALTRTDGQVFSPLWAPYKTYDGVAVTLYALSIAGSQPVGPVMASTRLTNISLRDDGAAPDLVAGDGIFSGTWIPAGEAVVTFTSPLGTVQQITNPLTIDKPATLFGTPISQPYLTQMVASGGELPYTWSIAAGTLPEGLFLNPATGEISGTPLMAGDFPFTIQVQGGPLTTKKDFALQVYTENVWLYNGGLTDDATAIARAADGSLYLTGRTMSPSWIPTNALLLKKSPTGETLWERQVNYLNRAYEDVAVDAAGNVIVCATEPLMIYGSYDKAFHVSKYDANGSLLWDRPFTNLDTHDGKSLFSSFLSGVAVAADGSIYATGFYSTCDETEDPYTGKIPSLACYETDAILIKYDASGNRLWYRLFNGGDPLLDPGYAYDGGRGIAVDAAGNVYVSGVTTVASAVVSGKRAALLVKYAPDGSLLGSWRYPLGLEAQGSEIALTTAGNPVMTGYVVSDSGDRDVLLLATDTQGTLLWQNLHHAAGEETGYSLTLHPEGDIFVAGGMTTATRDAALLRRYGGGGELLGENILDYSTQERWNDLVYDPAGAIQLIGTVTERTSTDTNPRTDIIHVAFPDQFEPLPGDQSPPQVTAFVLPSSATSLTVSILTFTAADDTGVTGYLVTESAESPAADASGWRTAPPASYTFASYGDKVLYAYARDAAGNVSAGRSAMVTVTQPAPVNTIAITKAEWSLRKKTLTVYATSQLMDQAGLALAGFGAMIWTPARTDWEFFGSVATNPGTVTVTGPEGSRTATVVQVR